ncbi:MAG TPA: hypothetical protein VN213_13545 [Solirubrobacteraceae bacterium]|nr:hypothetical protein [Solirubrobacteraceae bacterium]
MEPVIAALIDALIAERGVVVGSGDDATVEFVADHAIRIAAARELLDRAYGKPRQATEVTGPDGGPITLTVPTDGADRAARAAQLLATAGAIPGSTNGNGHHNGNGRH